MLPKRVQIHAFQVQNAQSRLLRLFFVFRLYYQITWALSILLFLYLFLCLCSYFLFPRLRLHLRLCLYRLRFELWLEAVVVHIVSVETHVEASISCTESSMSYIAAFNLVSSYNIPRRDYSSTNICCNIPHPPFRTCSEYLLKKVKPFFTFYINKQKTVKTGLSAIKLHQGKNKICNEKNLKIKSKLTKMEHANKTGFVIGPIFLLSNKNTHNNKIN